MNFLKFFYLQNNIEQKIPVRVTRGHASKNSYVGKVYTYDGLYEVWFNCFFFSMYHGFAGVTTINS